MDSWDLVERGTRLGVTITRTQRVNYVIIKPIFVDHTLTWLGNLKCLIRDFLCHVFTTFRSPESLRACCKPCIKLERAED